ncbi:hypothetical protein [Blastococcus sp. SYSU DS0541]
MHLATASSIAVLAHLRHHALDRRDLHTRVRLEREQKRTGVLLAQLYRAKTTRNAVGAGVAPPAPAPAG